MFWSLKSDYLCVLCGCLIVHISSFLMENIVEMLYGQNDTVDLLTVKIVLKRWSF